MTDLLLKPAPANPGEFYIIADDQIVGRITLYAGAESALPWMWVLELLTAGRPHSDPRLCRHPRGRPAGVRAELAWGGVKLSQKAPRI
jgi:hypothetical protein